MLKKGSKEELEQMDFKTFKPPDDPVYQYLLEEAVKGRVPVYFAAVPLALITPFAPDFHPEKSPEGEQIVQSIMTEWRAGNFRNL